MSSPAPTFLAPLLSPALPLTAHASTLQCDGLPVIRIDDFFDGAECASLISSLMPALPSQDKNASSRRQRLQADIVEAPLIDTIWARLQSAAVLSPDTAQMLQVRFSIFCKTFNS